jgi:hypothetical protein
VDVLVLGDREVAGGCSSYFPMESAHAAKLDASNKVATAHPDTFPTVGKSARL